MVDERGGGVLEGDSRIGYLLTSHRWNNFLESTATGLRLSLELVNSAGVAQTRVPAVCPTCGRSCAGAESPTVAALLPYGLTVRIQECAEAQTSGPSLGARAETAQQLLASFLITLGEEMSGGQRSVELATLRQVNRLVISMFHGEEKAADKALDLILSALVILLDAEGSWLEYVDQQKPRLLTKGSNSLIQAAIEGTEHRSLVTEVRGGRTYGRMGVVVPANRQQAELILPVLAEECLIVFEVERLFQIVQKRLMVVLGVVESAMLLLNPQGRITYANPAAERLLGSSLLNLFTLPYGELSGPWQAAIERRPERTERGQMEPLKVAGTRRMVDWSVHPLAEDGRALGWLLLIEDRTDHYLWQEAAHRADRLAMAAAMAGGLVEQLRTPLLTVQGLFQMVGRGRGHEFSRGYLRPIEHELDRALELLHHLTALGVSQARTFTSFDLITVMQDLSPVFSGMIGGETINVDLDLEPSPPVSADAGSVTQAILELVQNAVDALGTDGGNIRISLREFSGGSLVTVQDDGPGIDGRSDHLFRPFHSTKENGSGLGLAVVEAVAHQLGGWVRAQDGPQGGALFSIWLPAGVPDGTSGFIDVLVVTSDPLLRLPLEQVLRTAGFKTAVSEDLDGILDIAERSAPSLLLIDEWALGPEDLLMIGEVLPRSQAWLIGEKATEGPENRWQVLARPLDYARLVARVRTALEAERGEAG